MHSSHTFRLQFFVWFLSGQTDYKAKNIRVYIKLQSFSRYFFLNEYERENEKKNHKIMIHDEGTAKWTALKSTTDLKSNANPENTKKSISWWMLDAIMNAARIPNAH